MANPPPSLTQRASNFLAQRTVGGVTRGTAITTGLGLAVGAAGVGFAVRNAYDLYRSRLGAAGQFQQQLQFPSDLIDPTAGASGRSFYMSFTFMKYEKRSIQNSPFLRSEGTVRLPIPDGIRDNLSVTYTSPSLGPVVGAMLDSFSGSAGSANSETNTRSLFGITADTAVAGVTGLGADILGNRTGAAGQAAQAYLGLAVNPYQTVLFEKPEFKTHNFSWKFMPRDEKESEEARNIYRTFQFHASPGVSESAGVFFSYPSMVVVSLFPSSEFLYRFKPCVIKSVNINYAAGNNPSFFRRTNAPTSMTFSIQLQEIEYWTNRDYSAASFDETAAINTTNRIQDNNFMQLQALNSAVTPRSNVGE